MYDTYELCFMICVLLCFVKYIFSQYIEYIKIRSASDVKRLLILRHTKNVKRKILS